MSTKTLEMAQLLGDSFLERFDVTIELHTGETVTGTVNELLHDGVEVVGANLTWVVKLDDNVKDVRRV